MTIPHIYAYRAHMPKRMPNTLFPIEQSMLAVMVERELQMRPGIHGYDLAKELAKRENRNRLAGHGTIYRALWRLEEAGLITGVWAEDPQSEPGRPRRRLFRVTTAGAQALTASETARAALQLAEG